MSIIIAYSSTERMRQELRVFSFYVSAGFNPTHVDGEVLAIDTAVSRINIFQKAIILTDYKPQPKSYLM